MRRFRFFIAIPAIVLLTAGCAGDPASKKTTAAGDAPQELPPGPAGEESKSSGRPHDFAASVDIAGQTGPDRSLRVGDQTPACGGETTAARGGDIQYQATWTARWKRLGFADWVYRDITAEMTGASSAAIAASLAHLEISCRLRATSVTTAKTIEETVSAEAPYIKIINTDPAPFTVTLGGTRTGDSGLAAGALPADAVGSDYILAGDEVSCSGRTGDIDGDVLSYGVAWQYKISGSDGWEAAAGAAVHRILKDRAGAAFRCAVTAYDSSGGLQTAYSGAVVVGNRPPQAFASTLKYQTLGLFFTAGIDRTFTVGDVVSCDGETIDPDQTRGPVVTYEWRSHGTDNAAAPTVIATEKTIVLTAAAAHREISCAVIATDAIGAQTPSAFARYVVRNKAPEAFTARVEGDPRIGQTLKCAATPVDVDGDSLSRAVSWAAHDGTAAPAVALSQLTTETITVTTAMARRSLSCRIVVSDGFGGVTASPQTSAVAILNSRPSVAKAQVTVVGGGAAGVLKDLSCAAAVTDVDGDETNLSYVWQKADVDGGGYTAVSAREAAQSQATTPAQGPRIQISTHLAHKAIRCAVTARDAQGLSSEGDASDAVQVQNARPNIASFFVETSPSATDPDPPRRVLRVGEVFSCDAQTTDADGDALTYRRVWRAQRMNPQGQPTSSRIDIRSLLGVAAPAETSVTFVIPRSLAHHTIDCTVTADDGYEDGVVATEPSTPVLIDNTAPQPFTVGVPETARAGEVLSCDAVTGDVDGDAVMMSSLWRQQRAGDRPAQTTLAETVVIGARSVGDLFSCERRAVDGWGGETVYQSAQTVVVNTPPEPFLSLLSSTAAAETRVGDVITCAGATIDRDDTLDEPQIAYRSRFIELDALDREVGLLDGTAETASSRQLIGGNHSNAHLLTRLDAHKRIACIITASDGDGGERVAARSQAIVVTNTAPDSFASVMDAATPLRVGDEVSCGADRTITDRDGDQITMHFIWERAVRQPDPSPVYTRTFGLTDAAIIVPSLFGHGLIRCVAVADDGHGGVVSGTASAGRPLDNSAPEKIASRVVRVSAAEPLVTAPMTATDFSYQSSLSCEEGGPRFDRDGDQVIIDHYEWGVRDEAGSFTAAPSMGRDKTYELTDTTRRLVAHRDVACRIIVRDQAPEFITWSPSRFTEGDFGAAARYINAPPAAFSSTFSLTSSPSYDDVLRGVTVSMGGQLVVGSAVTCASAPLDPDNGGLTAPPLPDTIATTYQLQKKRVTPIFGLSVVTWLAVAGDGGDGLPADGPDQVIGRDAAHAVIRCEATAADDHGGVTRSLIMSENTVLNTPPIVTAAPTDDRPITVLENSNQSLPGGPADAAAALAATDPDGDPLTWSAPGVSSGAAWSSKARVTSSQRAGALYDIITTANPAAGSDGYDYASRATPLTSDASHFTASVTDGFTAASGPVYFKVENVDRAPVITGYRVTRTLVDGSVRTLASGEPLTLSEYNPSSVSTTTGVDTGCGASPDETPELYSGQGYYLEGSGDMNLSLASPLITPAAQSAAARAEIELLYTDLDGDQLSLTTGGSSGIVYNLPALKDPLGLYAGVAPAGVALSPVTATRARITVASCDVVAHTREFTNRDAAGASIPYLETAAGGNSRTGHYRRRWSAEMTARLDYTDDLTGDTMGSLSVPLRVLDVDRRAAVKWFGGSSSQPGVWSAVSPGQTVTVSEPNLPMISWRLSADPDGDAVEAFEYVASTSDPSKIFPFSSSYYRNGVASGDAAVYDFSRHLDAGIFSTVGLAAGGATSYLPTYWKILRDLGKQGYNQLILSSSAAAAFELSHQIAAVNITKSLCPNVATAPDQPPYTYTSADQTCAGAGAQSPNSPFRTALSLNRVGIEGLISFEDRAEVLNSVGPRGVVQNVPQCAGYQKTLTTWSTLSGTFCSTSQYYCDTSGVLRSLTSCPTFGFSLLFNPLMTVKIICVCSQSY